jgi:hypothetical protein
MRTLSCTPISLFPASRLTFASCQVRPGIRIVPFAGEIAATIGVFEAKHPLQPAFGPTHLVVIDANEYELDVRRALAAEGTSLPSTAFFPLETDPKLRQVCVSLLLAGGIGFSYGGSYDISVTLESRRERARATGYQHRQTLRMSEPVRAALSSVVQPVAPARLRSIARSVDRYYRSGAYWSDPLAIALNCLFSAAWASFPDQAFVSLATSLEALLTSSRGKITRPLAERCAILAERDPRRRVALYHEMKRLYGVRSKLVHGKVVLKKGRQTYDSLLVTAKRASVPVGDMNSMLGIAVSVVRAALADTEFLSCIQRPGGENATDKALNSYFAARPLA